ncbi:MAG: VOC family protein [Comamonadaceae bacterium]|nr:MAG: VOC family protein [Comamonadaceae bacterium]
MTNAGTGTAQVDHLVIVAASLAQGVQWCEATLGVTPGPGGEHLFMGTHNRLLRIATVDYPRAYLEIIAINPIANNVHPISTKRWFDMDCADLQARVAHEGPQLVHYVANVPEVRAAVQALDAIGIDRGPAVQASRMTPRGPLQWQITIRSDGQRLFDGCLPTLIQWGETHPAGGMPDSGVTLQSLAVAHPRAEALRQASAVLGLRTPVHEGPANLCAVLQTPRGTVKLNSKGI